MSIYINKKILDLKEIRDESGNYYIGGDEVKKLLAETWKMFDKKFFQKNLPVTFVTPGIRSGLGKGNQGYSFPRVIKYKTKKQGPVEIAWADGIKNEEGRDFFFPITEKVGINDKTMMLGEDDIEKILFMYLFNPNMVNEQRHAGKTFLEDKEADALQYEKIEQTNAIVAYWLFRPESPFYANDEKIDILCLTWGINPDGKSTAYKKQLLAEAVKKGEKANDRDRNMNALNDRCERLKDGQDTREIEIMANIQRALNNRIIAFDFQKFNWSLLGMDGKPIKTICKVPPVQATQKDYKLALKRYLIQNGEDYNTIQASLSQEAMSTKSESVYLQDPLPEIVTEEYITTQMSWPDRKAVYRFIGGEDPMHSGKDVIHAKLIEFFVKEKNTVNFELKRQ